MALASCVMRVATEETGRRIQCAAPESSTFYTTVIPNRATATIGALLVSKPLFKVDNDPWKGLT
jgi:hypothetical protein